MRFVEYEASLLRLIEKITNGCTIEIDVTGIYSLYSFLEKRSGDLAFCDSLA
jgi:hypothetical protein